MSASRQQASFAHDGLWNIWKLDRARCAKNEPSTQTISETGGGCVISPYDFVNEYHAFLTTSFFQTHNRALLGFEEINHEVKYHRKRFPNAIVSGVLDQPTGF